MYVIILLVIVGGIMEEVKDNYEKLISLSKEELDKIYSEMSLLEIEELLAQIKDGEDDE